MTASNSTPQRVEEADIIVVGGGGSGLASAISARVNGASVILLEKNEQIGGSTGMSIGSITSTRTPHQRKAGIVDSPEEHSEDMVKFAGKLAPQDNPDLRRILVENVPDTVEWLMSLGITLYGPMPEPPHRKPRMHNILPNSKAYIYHLGREARRQGVDIRVNAPMRSLEIKDGRVVGVNTTIAGVAHQFRGRKAVILASGDYSGSSQLKGRFHRRMANVDAVNVNNHGDAQRIGEELGAAVPNGEVIYGPSLRFMPPPKINIFLRLPPYRWVTKMMVVALEMLPAWLLRPFILQFVTTYLAPEASMFEQGAILVNKKGERFTDELDSPGFDFPDQPDKVGYILFDAPVAEKFKGWPHFISTAPGVAYAYLPDYRRTRPDLYHEGKSLDDLASAIGVPAETLKATVERYNAALAESKRNDTETRQPISKGPYCALGPVKSWVVLTDGGLTVNTNHQVIKADGTVIPGLYAAGSAGQGGLLLEGHGHHLGWAFTSGRLAGKHAATAS